MRDAALSAPSNHSLGVRVLDATKGVVGLTRNLLHGPSIPSPGSIPLRDTKQMLQTRMLLRGMHCLRLEGQQALHPSPVWVPGPVQMLGAIPTAWNDPGSDPLERQPSNPLLGLQKPPVWPW